MSDSGTAIISAIVPSSAEAVYAAWLNPALLPRWLAPPPYELVHADVEPRIGGRYRHDTRGPDGEHIVTGKYRELQLGRRIIKTWNYSGPNPVPRQEPTVVKVQFHTRDDGSTTVTITHSGLRDEAEYRHYNEGWAHCLERLKRL